MRSQKIGNEKDTGRKVIAAFLYLLCYHAFLLLTVWTIPPTQRYFSTFATFLSFPSLSAVTLSICSHYQNSVKDDHLTRPT